MPIELVDTHAHLDEEAFRTDLDEVIERAREAGVMRIVTIGTTAESSRSAVEIASRFDNVFAVVGIQPNYVSQAAPDDWEAIEQLAGEPKVVAIGETGLDRYWDYAPIDEQQEYFTRHLDLARRLNLPFTIHCREAEDDVVARLKAQAGTAGPLRGIMHSFAGNLETACACLELGMHISFSGMVTYKKNRELRSVAAEIPADRILIETDAPYLAPTPRRGKRNEPALVRHTAECVAETRGVSVDDVARQTTGNACELFGWE